MLSFIRLYQVNILFFCGILCALFALFVAIIKMQSFPKKKALFMLELSVAGILISDGLAYKFGGHEIGINYFLSNFFACLVFILTCSGVFFFNQFITSLFMERRIFKVLPKHLKVCFLLPVAGAVLSVIAFFIRFFSLFGAKGYYHMSPVYLAGYLIPFTVMLIQFFFLLKYRRVLNKGLFCAVVIFTVLPIITSVVQIWLYSISLIDFSLFIAAFLLYMVALVDQNNELVQSVITDYETGLPNARGYMYKVVSIIHNGDITQYSAFYFDISRMSRINRKFGKENGDVVIKKYIDFIKSHLEEDELLGRLGGNYFIALIKKNNTYSFIDILQDVPVEIIYNNEPYVLHISSVAGIYEINDKNIEPSQIMEATGAAVSYAKRQAHKPYVFMTEEIEKEITQMRQIEENARKGIVDREFEAFYQPKVDSRTNELVGAEALVRWRQNDKLIPPVAFIPILEKNASICEVDFYVLNNVCRDMREWIDKGMNPPRVSVNFSRRNLENKNLAKDIYNVIKEYNIPADLIQVELTETIDEHPISKIKEVIEEIRSYGMTCAMDDFGTGSSSIRILLDVEFDVLKIDKVFIDYKNDEEHEILSYIIKMAKARGIDVIAEGVESKEQISELKSMECYDIQGYVFDKPLEKKEYEKRLVSRKYE